MLIASENGLGKILTGIWVEYAAISDLSRTGGLAFPQQWLRDAYLAPSGIDVPVTRTTEPQPALTRSKARAGYTWEVC